MAKKPPPTVSSTVALSDKQQAFADVILAGKVTGKAARARAAGYSPIGAHVAATRALKSASVQRYISEKLALRAGYARGLAEQSLALVGRGVTSAGAAADADPVLAVGVGAKAISASAEYLERIGEQIEAPEDLAAAGLRAARDLLRAYLHGLEAGMRGRSDLGPLVRRTLGRLTGDQRWTDVDAQLVE